MTTRARPLSPHLQIYRFPLVMMMSGMHRMTGIVLAVGAVLLAAWLGSAAYGPRTYALMSAFWGSWFGYLLLFGWSVALYWHLCTGIRHLFWDIGKGFDLTTVRKTNVLVLLGVAALTVITWAVALSL